MTATLNTLSEDETVLLHIHHVAIICSDYETSKRFYVEILGFPIIRETYRAERHSYKLDLQINDHTAIELFSFPDPPPRVSRPEACGLRHLAFAVDDLESVAADLQAKGVELEPIRFDQLTGKRFLFFQDPDGLPLELYEL
ncbi:VOC family protein [Leptolyngbya sp. NK1-12]|uniref:VOC family protein n=1 Tax=Leptolyngbya sp. NK1-12 TaxID=2547451 RepID=A0AA96WFF8_9CYAN|nr:VOC family protein [Leptolyngbya sp. NK1-12]WNZ24100.1 VOC family protein [Leptolyngbya sp. NK1-12]